MARKQAEEVHVPKPHLPLPEIHSTGTLRQQTDYLSTGAQCGVSNMQLLTQGRARVNSIFSL